MIKEGNRAVDNPVNDSKKVRTGLRTVSGQMASLIRSVEELSGQAIAAANRDKCQRQALEKIEAHLAALEKKPGPPPAASPPQGDVTMRGTSPTPHRRPHCLPQ